MTNKDPSRRRFLQLVGLGLAAPAVLRFGAACADDTVKLRPITDGASYFPQSIASGDPRPDSIVLWARAVDAAATGDLKLTLLVSETEDMADPSVTQTLTANAANDYVVKIRLSGLDAATRYYYRFVYESPDLRLGSRIGRTKTAPTADADVPVKFALVCCQDFIGRYYHSYAKMLTMVDELDVVVHLGDYVYETTGDPTFQASPSGARGVYFTDTAGAIAFQDDSGKVTHYAAQSLANYRELYKTYRSDPDLQAVHEKVPFVFVWDDHEFSDDCWADNATYFDGRVDENGQTTRRGNAERANFEFLPSGHGLNTAGNALDIGTKVPVTDSGTFIYRDFRFGKHCHLVMSDTRTYRPDHLLPEDVHYARVSIDAAGLVAAGIDPEALGDGGVNLYPTVVDIDDAAYAAYKPLLLAAVVKQYQAELPTETEAQATARATAQVKGHWSAVAINALLKDDITAARVTALDVSTTSVLTRGATYDHLRFSAETLFAADGLHARYLVEKKHYEAMAKARYAADPASQDVFGATQETWLRTTLQGSTATWKMLASSISMTSMILDVSAAGFPAVLANHPDRDLVIEGLGLFRNLLRSPFLFSVDQWDGFPQKRDALLDLLRGIPNSLILSGDIHSFYATEHVKGTGANGVVEFTGGGISSESFKGFVRAKVDSVAAGISQLPSVVAVVKHLEDFLKSTYPELEFANNDAAGFITFALDANACNATMYLAPIEHVTVDTAGDSAAAIAPYEAVSFKVENGTLTKV